jgi:serine/threonine protein kinase
MLTDSYRWHLFQGLEGFKLVEKMGDGAFSNVYKAIDRTSGQKVAGKLYISAARSRGLLPDCDVTHFSQGRQEVRAQRHSSESRSFSYVFISEAGPPAGSRGKSILGEETWVSRKCASASCFFLPRALSHLRDS